MNAKELEIEKNILKELTYLYDRLNDLYVEIQQPWVNVEQLEAHIINIRSSQMRLTETIKPLAKIMNKMVDGKRKKSSLCG